MPFSISLKSRTWPRGERAQASSPALRRDLRITGDVLTSLFIAAAVIAVGAVVGFMLYGFSHSNRIYEGVSVAGIQVGGMTRAEARQVISSDLEAIASRPILLVGSGQQYSFDPSASGITVDVEASLDAAFNYGRDGSLWSRTQDWAGAIIGNQDVPVQFEIDESTVDATLRSVAASVTRPPQDAYVTYGDSGEPIIVPELPGFAFDVASTRQAIVDRMLDPSDQPVELVTPLVAATTRVQDLEGGVEEIKQALQSPLLVEGLGKYWGINPEGLQQIITYSGATGEIVVDRNAVASFVRGIAEKVDRPIEDAGITVGLDGRLTALPGQSSIAVRQDEMTSAVIEALQSGEHRVELAYESEEPAIQDDVAMAAAAFGEELLEKGVTVSWDGGSTTLDRADLLAALTVRIRSGEEIPFVFGFDGKKLTETLTPTFEQIAIDVKEPRLRLINGTIQPAQKGASGRQVDVEKSIETIVDAAATGKGEARLTVVTVEPKLTLPAIEQIKLNDVLAESSTYYGDSSDARRNNVERASQLESGWLIGPGQQFSYVEFIGEITEDSGFVTGFGIVDDPSGTGVTTAPVIGGGICQVSTTIFQAAFWAGMQIDERHSHPYWIQSYGEPPRGMKGLDAMVNIEESGSLDLKFTNTTPNWIAVEVIADGTVVTVRILGTDPGWTVDVRQPVLSDTIKPDTATRYTDSPELPDGQQLQVEYAQEGFTAEITRVITDRDGQVIDSGILLSSYAPSQNTILRGTRSESTPEAA